MKRWSDVTLLVFTWLASSSLACPEDKTLPVPKKGPLTLHVLNTATGKPAVGVEVRLERQSDKSWVELRKGKTNENGRLDLSPDDNRLQVGVYRLVFETGAYFRAQGQKTFFPRVEVVFEVDNPDEHYHVPLLLSPFSYSTYRGS
jgi:5-hydroxyisourate hydrolase